MGLDAEDVLSVTDIPLTTVDGGEPRAKLGDVATNVGSASSQTFWGPDGYFAIPNEPTTANDPEGVGAPQALVGADGNQRHVIGVRDKRFAKKTGNMKPGDRYIVTNGGARFMVRRSGKVSMYTTHDNTDNGLAVSAGVSSTNGFEVNTPWGTMSLGPMGFRLVTPWGAIRISGAAGLPGPLSVLKGNMTLESGKVRVKGAVTIGSDNGSKNEIGVTALSAILTSLAAALTTVSATPAAPGSSVLPPAQAAALTTLVTAFAAPGGAASSIGKIL